MKKKRINFCLCSVGYYSILYYTVIYYTPTGSFEKWDSSVGVATRLYAGLHGNNFQQCREIFIRSENQAQI